MKTKKKKAKETSYRAHKGSVFTDSQAQEIGDNLEVIRQFHDGELTPEQVLEFASKESSQLHKYFEWDDSVAAEKYRLNQAGQMVRAVYVEIETISGPTETRAFVSIKSHKDNKRRYTTISEAIDDEDYRDQIIADAARQLTMWRNKYNQYQEFKPVISAIDRLKV